MSIGGVEAWLPSGRAGPRIACSDVTASPANDLGLLFHQLANIKYLLTTVAQTPRGQDGSFGGGGEEDE